MTEELWRVIPEFRNYEVSNFGRIYNIRARQEMKTSRTNHGHIKITLSSDWNSDRFTRSVARLVAEAFVEPPNLLCDQVMMLDGDISNVKADNLVWRPQWFAWKYVRQLKIPQPIHYHNLSVLNLNTEVEYRSIAEAGMTEGLLFYDIWVSTYTKRLVFPYGFVFEITERV